MLGALARRFDAAPLSIVGVHIGKFPAESDPERVERAIQRLGVHHPVVVDRDRRIGQSYAVRAWPTIVILRPDGTIAATLPGEPEPRNLEEIVLSLLAEAGAAARVDSVEISGERAAESGVETRNSPGQPASLSFPGKVLALPEGLAVSDSGHHRVVLLDVRGRVRTILGGDDSDFRDGGPREARFRNPQGLALGPAHLFVADAGNHALRAVDVQTLEVETLAGDGTLGGGFPTDLVPASEVRLRSPWDLLYLDGVVLIAMAGFHQIWAYLPVERRISVVAGTGRESIDDGPLHLASFSQPMGLAANGRTVYVADSESSSVREIDLDTARARTIVGAGLFVFGDVEGPRERARLQHPQAVSFGPHGLLVADTFNDKIKRVDPETGRVTTWYAGEESKDSRPSEPGGLVQLAGGQVIVADTNRHRLLVIDTSGKTAKPLIVSEGCPRPTDSGKGDSV